MGGTGQVTALILGISLGVLISPVEGRFLRFEPGYEYQYKFHSDAQVHGVDTFTVAARVGYSCLRELDEGQEVTIRVIAFTLESSKTSQAQGHDWDFSKWFSFVLTSHGEVLRVLHEPDEQAEILAIKKALASILAARLHDDKDKDIIDIISTNDGWKYHIQETGHEGLHNATYEVHASDDGKIFTKTRHSHPVPHATGAYTKTMHYHEGMRILHTVEVQEHFDILDNPPEGYTSHFKGHQSPDIHFEDEKAVVPSMTGQGHGKLEFLTRLHLRNEPELPKVKLVTGSVHVDKVPSRQPHANLTAVMDDITGNLTCMRLQPAKGSKALMDCFAFMLDVLQQLPDPDLEKLAQDYFGPKSREEHYQRDRESMMDGLWSVKSDHVQQLLTESVLLAEDPEVIFVERLLYHVASTDNLPAESILQTIISLAFKPEVHAAIFHKGEIHHRVLLTLGVFINLLNKDGQTERALELALKLQSMLGIHDPWVYRKKRETMTEQETIDEDLRKVVLLETLGNGRLDQSYEYIVSHVNSTNSQWVKRAGVHALRDYRHDHAADVILMAALYDEHETVRYEAAQLYRRHPNNHLFDASLDDTVVHENETAGGNGSVYADPLTSDLTGLEPHDRRRRAIKLFEPLKFLIKSPSVQWEKIIGSDKIGASFGLFIKNELDISIALLSGHAKVDIHDEAFGQVNLGFMGQNLDILRARLCFRGHAEYNLNIFQEFDVGEIKRLVDLFDKLKKQTIDAVVDGIQLFRNLLEGDLSFEKILKGFVDTLTNLPDKIVNAGEKAAEALRKIGEFDESELPPFITPLKNLVLKINNLVDDIQSDVLGFYNKLMTATVVIPNAGKQIFTSVKDIINGLKHFNKDPKGAISSVTSGSLTIGIQVKAVVDAVQEVKEASFFLKGQQPYWFDLRSQAEELIALSQEVAQQIKTQGPKWINATIHGVKNEIETFTEGHISLAQLKQQAIKELMEVPEVAKTILDLDSLGGDILKTFADLFNLVETMKTAYDQLKNGSRKAKEFIERIFGPKAHKLFPRQTRVSDSKCKGEGFYPAELQDGQEEYEYDGVDLLMEEGMEVVAPFSGVIYLSEKPNEVIIESRGGSPQDAEFIITNISPNDTILKQSDPLYSELQVTAGQVIGTAVESRCYANHIHFAIKRDDGTIDPTRFLEPRFGEMPKWVQECDDYKFVFKMRTLAAGSIVGLLGRKEEDTSPEHDPEVPTPQEIADSFDPGDALDADIFDEPDSVASQVSSSRQEAAVAAKGSKDSALKTLFQNIGAFLKNFNIKDMKLGALVRFLHALKFEDSVGKMAKIFQTVQSMLNNKPCLNPNQMSDDELKAELKKQGKDTLGTRDELIRSLTAHGGKCPMLSLGLPKQIHCTMDQHCLGIECCVDVKVSIFRKVYKVYARLDPCDFAVVVGLAGNEVFEKSFGPGFGLDNIIGGFDETIATGFRINQLDAELFLRVLFEKESTGAMLTVTVKFCKKNNYDDCIVEINVLDRAIMPVPVCGADGSLFFPEVDWKRMLNNQVDRLKKDVIETGKEVAKNAVDYIFDKIPCLASDDDSDGLPCVRPDTLSEETLIQTLKDRSLASTGTREERIARLKLDDRTCSVLGKTITLPDISSSKLAKYAYLTIDKKCLGVEACIDIPIPQLNYSRSVRASLSLDACMPTIRARFETCHHEILLFNNTIDMNTEFPLSDFFALKANIVKRTGDTAYKVGLGMRIQLGKNTVPVLDDMLVTDLQIPVPLCSDFRLPNTSSMRQILSNTAISVTTNVVRYFMKTLKLDTILTEGTCTEEQMIETVCPWSINVTRYLPDALRSHVKCVMTPNCLGLKCCLDISIKLPLMNKAIDYYLPLHFIFSPCDNMKIDLKFGSYQKEEHLLEYDFGSSKTLSIGRGQNVEDAAPIQITFAMDHYLKQDPFDEGFLLDLNIRVCIPFDGETICIPDNKGLNLLSKQKFPVCSPRTLEQIKNFNLTKFLEDNKLVTGSVANGSVANGSVATGSVAKSLPRSGAQLLLNMFGITDHLKEQRCDPFRQPYVPAQDGWKNDCPLSTRGLPSLPQNMACHISEACNRVDCCVYSQFLDMSFNVWFELNCDLYLQAGIEKLLSPRLYVVGEVDWNTGITGGLNISEAFQFEYRIRKDKTNFIVDGTIKLCFDQLGGGCQFRLNIMAGTRIPQLGCIPDSIPFFSSIQLFKWEKCQLQEPAQGCQISLPSVLNEVCVYTKDCHAIQCCVPVDLGLLGQYAVNASFEVDTCTNTFTYTLERKSAKLSLPAITGYSQKETFSGGGLTFTMSYGVEQTLGGYKLYANLSMCAQNPLNGKPLGCYDYSVIPKNVTIHTPPVHCARKRRRRQAEQKWNCAASPIPSNDLWLQMIEAGASTEEIQACIQEFQRKEESKCDQLQGDHGDEANTFTLKGILGALTSSSPSSLVYCNKRALVTVNVEGFDLIEKMLNKVDDIKGRFESTYIPGKGLTGEGAKALGLKIANMTIGELQAYVMSEGIDPELALELMKDMKNLVSTLFSELISKLISGGVEDLFKSFDLTLSGDFSVPRRDETLFQYNYFFLVGGIVPMHFGFGAGISYGMDIEVGAKIMSMTVYGEIKPYVGIKVYGYLAVGFVLYGKLELTGYICQTSLPSRAEIGFSKFPLDLQLNMDLVLAPLELKLDALVTLEVKLLFVKIKKTLFKANLWYYKAPVINQRVLAIGTKEEDKTPPSFAPYKDTKEGRRRRAISTNHCLVRQLPGLDYTEPSIEIAVAAGDDRSKVTLRAYAGRAPGLEDLLAIELGGPSTIIRELLPVSGDSVYIKVRATSNDGASSEVTCILDNYDVTLPTGRLEADFTTTSNRHVLHGSLVVYEDSPIIKSDLAVGLGKGVYGYGVYPWTAVELNDDQTRVYDANGDPFGHKALEYFTDFKKGKLVPQSSHFVTRALTAQHVGECARQCLLLPELKCMSFNYHSKGACELLAAIVGHDHKLAQADLTLHYERIGVGLAKQFQLNIPKPMLHNSVYFFNLHLQNSLLMSRIIHSQGTLVDLTPPSPGPVNISTSYMEVVPCLENLPHERAGEDDWGKWCRGVDPLLPNHLVIVDGPGSKTLFNGHTPLEDLMYTKANTFISANWDGFHDDQSSIRGYSLTAGRKPCEELLHEYHDPHRHLVPLDDETQWTHTGIMNMKEGRKVPDGKYYVTIRALNKVEYGGPLATTVCHTTPYVIDTTPPEIYEVYGTRYDEMTYLITTKYNASDPHSDIKSSWICLGRTVLNCDILGWVEADTESKTEGPASITNQIINGVPVWIRIRVQNYVELQAVGHADSPIIVDITPPLVGKVYDGPLTRHDLSYSKDSNMYCANWYNFTDPESGIGFYMGAVTSASGQLLTELEVLDRRQSMQCIQFSNPSLKHNTSYHFMLVAFNGGHKQLNVTSISDGVLVDLTPPKEGKVIDGLSENFEDLHFSVHKSTVAARWQGFSDSESGIMQYEVQIERAENLTANFQVLQDWENVNLDTTFEKHRFSLRHRDVVKTKLRVSNGALNTVTSETDSFIIDLTPPELYSLWDGLGSSDIEYQSSITSLSAKFEFHDDESGIDYYKYQVYQTMHGHHTQIIPATKNDWNRLPSGPRNSLTVNDLTLTSGLRYSIRMAAVNSAGSVTTYDTNGVLVDNTPPTMERVHVGVLSSEDEIDLDGYVLQSDQSGIKANWLATDHESGIDHYEVAVGTSPGATDMLEWRNVGKEQDRYISGLNLQLTDNNTDIPLYYVTVRAYNSAGDVSPSLISKKIKILQEDKAGVVVDGGLDTVLLSSVGQNDEDYQSNMWSVTAQFRGFSSHLHGLTHFDWAVGSSPGAEDVLPLMAMGIVHDEEEDQTPGMGIASRGVAHAVLALEPGKKYYTTVRALNNNGQAVQSTSDGFTVDREKPKLGLISLSSETNTSALLMPEKVFYQQEPNALSARWTFADANSIVKKLHFSVGSYPGASDIKSVTEVTVTETGEAALPSGRIDLKTDGRPSILTLWAEDSVGLNTQLVSPTIVVDASPPDQGTVVCPSFIQTHSQVACTWAGFEDLQSPITSFTFYMGTQPGLDDVIAPVIMEGHMTSYTVSGLKDIVKHQAKVYATVVAKNAIGLTTMAQSRPVSMDTSPPLAGTVVELNDAYIIIADNVTATNLANVFTCNSQDECKTIDVVCQESLTSVLVAWSPFEDPETGISKYEVAIGYTPGGGQIKEFHEVPSGVRYQLVSGLDLYGQRQIFASVKATNGAGASTVATSNGVHMSYLSQGLTPAGPVVVWDGNSTDGDLDYQTDLMSISASWETDGDPCPAVSYQWAIERVDGLRIQEFTETYGKMNGLNDGLSLLDLETYYQLLKVTNALGYSYTLRSDGITIKQDPLIPGLVFDGSKTGFDLSYQPSNKRVSVNWNGFGEKSTTSQVSQNETSATDIEIAQNGRQSSQEVAYYEVALGTDRRYDSTRDNIVPWTKVGQNTSVTFYDLDLVPGEAIYYFSVRAHSSSNSIAEVTSNGFSVGYDGGVQGGGIEVAAYISSTNQVQFTWNGFQSSVGMFLYFAALSTQPVDNSSCQVFVDGGGMSASDRQRMFDIADCANTGMNTYATFTNISMMQNADVYAHVIGVDRAGECHMVSTSFHIDVTPPSSGKIRAGPYFDMALAFAPSKKEVTAVWQNFRDDESPLISYTLELLAQAKCDATVQPGGNIIASVNINYTFTTYTFRDLDLTEGHPYFVRVTATNKAGLTTSVTSSPILFDTSDPTPGRVVVGRDFHTDATWINTNTEATATVLHCPTPQGPACPSRHISFTDSGWRYLEGSHLFDTSSRQLDLISNRYKAVVSSDGSQVTVTLTRDTNLQHMYGTSLLHKADLLKNSIYEMNIKAANGDGKAVTAVTLWDGDTNSMTHFDYTVKLQEEFCMCCYDNPRTAECVSVCLDCDSYIADKGPSRTKRSVDFTGDNIDEISTVQGVLNLRKKREVVKLTDQKKEELLNHGLSDGLLTASAPKARACGIQLYTLSTQDPEYSDGFRGRLVTWCTYGPKVTYEPKSVMRLLEFDPAIQKHHYKLVFYESADEATTPTKCLGVYVDQELSSTICGIPDLSQDTDLVLNVWNWKNFKNAPNVTSTSIALWQTFASFSDLIMPAPKESLCRYGDPFRGGQNPIVRFEGGIGSDVGLDNVMPFTEIYSPCIPCERDCSKYNCDPKCDANITSSLILTLRNLTLQVVKDTGDGDEQPQVYFFTVKAVLGSGKTAMASSNGFSIDQTPPMFDQTVFLYMDAAHGEAKPVERLMASNSTMQVVYGCSDNQSSVVEYKWAIGTTPGGQDIQSFTSTGMNPSGINSSLEGIIFHNQRYYVSVRCTNAAGLTTTYEDNVGVLAILENPAPDDIGVEMNGTKQFDPDTRPVTSRKSSDKNSISINLQVSADPTVDEYYISIGSQKEGRCCDILPRTLVATNMSGVVSIRNGCLYINDEKLIDLRNSQPGANGSDTAASSSDFQMAPGSELFLYVDACNEARCTGPEMRGSVLIVGDHSEQAVSRNGSSVQLALSTARRQKRSTSNIVVTTQNGMAVGQTVVLTPLTHADLNATYDSVASTDFVSYLTNPEDTLNSVDTVDRILVRRASYSPTESISFSLASVGQVEMPGPFTVTYPYDPSDSDSVLTLMHWNPVLQKWQQSADTCDNKTDSVVIDEGSQTITVKVCSTYGTSTYFMKQTQFLLSAVSKNISNNEPVLTSSTNLTMKEDEGTFLYKVQTFDEDGDTVIIQLHDIEPLSPNQGELLLARGNLVLFTPCADCSGTYLIRLLLKESPVTGIPPATATITLTVDVTAVNDAPVAFTFHNGRDLMPPDPAAAIQMLLEQNRLDYSDNVTFTFVVGAYDVDKGDSLVFTVEGPYNGSLTMGTIITAVPSCSYSVQPQDNIPCAMMTLPHPATSLSWQYVSLTYQPHEGFYGFDTLLFMAKDQGGLGSLVTTYQFAVMERPCQNNGYCTSKDSSYTCEDAKRAEGFESYYKCRCNAGYTGTYCEADIDDCLQDPCSWPYVCVDKVNDYSCDCPAEDPSCDGLQGWLIAVIVFSSILFVAGVIAVIVVWAVRTNRLTCFKRMTDKHANDERSGTPPPDYAFNNEAYEDIDYSAPLTYTRPVSFIRSPQTSRISRMLKAMTAKVSPDPHSSQGGTTSPAPSSSQMNRTSSSVSTSFNLPRLVPDHHHDSSDEGLQFVGQNVPQKDDLTPLAKSAYTHGIAESAGRDSAGHRRKSSPCVTPVERSLPEDLKW